MEIICPVCKNKNRFGIKVVLKGQCTECKEEFAEHYSKRLRKVKGISEFLVAFVIGAYFIHDGILQTCVALLVAFFLCIGIEFFCLKTIEQ